jgi:hypothetical protein
MATDPKSEKARRVFVLADTHNRLPESVTEMAKAFENGYDESLATIKGRFWYVRLKKRF